MRVCGRPFSESSSVWSVFVYQGVCVCALVSLKSYRSTYIEYGDCCTCFRKGLARAEAEISFSRKGHPVVFRARVEIYCKGKEEKALKSLLLHFCCVSV